MSLKDRNHQMVKWFLALVAVAAVALATVPQSSAQIIRGVPASVTSQNFGGHTNHAPGIPASVTSTGSIAPRVHRGNRSLPTAGCCINPLTPSNPSRVAHRRREIRNRGGEVFVPYYAGYYSNLYYGDEEEAQQPQQAPAPVDQYNGGPTIFDRRGPGENEFPQSAATPQNQQQQVASAAPEQPKTETPEVSTVLVFKDGHQLEVSNYAIVGSTLIDLTAGHRRKIALADLDLQATAKQNDDRGVDFALPSAPQG